MISENKNKVQRDELRRQLANALGADVQRLHVYFSLYENAFVQGALSSQVKHLIALAMAIGKRNSETITYHVREALQAGASRDEISETVTVAVFMAGVSSLLAGVEALASVTQFEAEKAICSGVPPANG